MKLQKLWKFPFPPTFCNFGKEKLGKNLRKLEVRKREIVDFKFKCQSDSSMLFGISLINVKTSSLSQMNIYLGFGRFLLNTLIIKLQTFGWLPTG